MKKLVPLFAALLVAGCGEKSSSEGSDSPGASAEPSADATQESEKPVNVPLSDTDVERLLKEAVDYDSLEERDAIFYQGNTPYSGWVKKMIAAENLPKHQRQFSNLIAGNNLWHLKDGVGNGPWLRWYENGQKAGEKTFKDGKLHGPFTGLHENGQKAVEVTYKDGKADGLMIEWHENGQKRGEVTYKDGEKVSGKYWDRSGKEVETREEALHE